MAFPIWLTPAGNLGIIPENEYYELVLDAYSPDGSQIKYSFLSGQLPPGIQVDQRGILKGVPVVTSKENVNESYEFSVRAKNNTNKVSDRTFYLTITNIVPPQIVPEINFLGNYFDGTYFELQLDATAVNPDATLTWTIESGQLPAGLSLDSNGKISGYVDLLKPQGTTAQSGYNSSYYNQYGYNAGEIYWFNSYYFTIRVFDGINYDNQSYKLNIAPKRYWTADSTAQLVNDTYLTVDADNMYKPIVTTPPQSFPLIRSDSKFAFKFDAFDPDGSAVIYAISDALTSGFDSNGDNEFHLTGVGWDTTLFDQLGDALPSGLQLDGATGWLVGDIDPQVEAELSYYFSIVAYKAEDLNYVSKPVYYTMTVLGSLNNAIVWETPSDLGTILNGSISELALVARSTLGKELVYSWVDAGSRRPQGLQLTSDGLLSGRCTFEYFTLDHGRTTFDSGSSLFDSEYTFTVKAEAVDGTVSSTKTFTVKIDNVNSLPYENLYLTALLEYDERQTFADIMSNQTLFPDDLIYRKNDPWFGKNNKVNSLFLPGVNPHEVSEYVAAMQTNHFTKRIPFNNVKTARAVDENFNTKYEVVYVELGDNAAVNGKSPPNTIDLTGKINPWYDEQGNPYTVAQPNGFPNMTSVLNNALGNPNQTGIPNWMTSPQKDGSTLGFVHALVLAYTVPGASELIAYRLRSLNVDFNNVPFVADRYILENHLTKNYDNALNSFIVSKETTFDRIIRPGTVKYVADYAIRGLSFDQVNNATIGEIIAAGGFDGVTNFQDGQTLIFAQQEQYPNETSANDGWNLVTESGTTIVPGYLDYLVSQGSPNPVDNQRSGIWKIVIHPSEDAPTYASSFGSDTIGFDTRVYDDLYPLTKPFVFNNQVVTLEFVKTVLVTEEVQINFGQTYGSSVVFYDPTLNANQSVPAYNKVTNVTQSRTSRTIFDGNGTRFMSNRDNYATPNTSNTYLKYPKFGLFK